MAAILGNHKKMLKARNNFILPQSPQRQTTCQYHLEEGVDLEYKIYPRYTCEVQDNNTIFQQIQKHTIWFTQKCKAENKPKLSIATETVLRLVAPVFGTGRNVTGDNLHSSFKLFNELQKINLIYVGTLKKINSLFHYNAYYLNSVLSIILLQVNFCSYHCVSLSKVKQGCVILMHNDNMVDDVNNGHFPYGRNVSAQQQSIVLLLHERNLNYQPSLPRES